MSPRLRTTLAATVLILTTPGLAACGDDGKKEPAAGASSPVPSAEASSQAAQAPKAAKVKDFCGSIRDTSGIEDGADLREAAEKWVARGTPANMSNLARKGFEKYYARLLTADFSLKKNKLDDFISPTPKEAASPAYRAYLAYLADKCAKFGGNQ